MTRAPHDTVGHQGVHHSVAPVGELIPLRDERFDGGDGAGGDQRGQPNVRPVRSQPHPSDLASAIPTVRHARCGGVPPAGAAAPFASAYGFWFQTRSRSCAVLHGLSASHGRHTRHVAHPVVVGIDAEGGDSAALGSVVSL